MASTHTAAVLYGAKDLRIEARETQAPAANQVQIAIRATGICGSDLHYYANGRNGPFVVDSPLTLGHESAGEVVAIGKEVKKFKVGDRVAIEPQNPCRTCEVCKRGTYNLCPEMKFSGSASSTPYTHGSLQQLYNHAEDFTHALPSQLSYSEGAMMEPLSVAVHTVRRSRLRAGESVLVLGAGAIGMLCAEVAKVSGASRIGIIDIDQGRLDIATAQGAGKVGVVSKSFVIPKSPADGESTTAFAVRVAQEVNSQTGFERADVVYETTGVPSCTDMAIHCAAPGGRVILVGMGSAVQTLNVGAAAQREVDLIGIWRYANTYPTAISFAASGQVDVKPILTHAFPLEQAEEAFKLALSGKAGAIRCIIESSP